MNIVFVLDSTFPCYTGGRENWLSHVSKRLAGRGHVIHVMAIQPGRRDQAHYDLPPEVRLASIGVPFYHGIGGKLLRGPFGVLKSAFVALAFRRSIEKVLAGLEAPRIITLDTVVTPLAIGRHLRHRVVNICASKGPHAEVMAAKNPLLKQLFFYLEKRAYALADEVWSNGYDMEEYISRQGYSSIMVGNGIDVQAWGQSCAEPEEYLRLGAKRRVVSIGTILPIKGVAEAVKAVAALGRGAGDDFHLVWVGKGDAKPYLKIAAADGAANNLDFIGNRKDVRPYTTHAHALLCLSGGGGLSMAALESMASGVPVVAWDTPVYRQIIRDGDSGFLVPYGDIDMLAAAIKRAADLSGEDREKLTSKARAIAVSYDWEGIVSKIEDRLSGSGK